MMGCGLGIGLLERLSPGVVEPVRRLISSPMDAYFRPILETTRAGTRLAHRVSNLWAVESDYQTLQHELMRAQNELQLAQEELRRLGRIAGLRQWNRSAELEFVLADVIGFSTSGRKAEWIINRGAFDGLHVGLPVVGQGGLAGVVREVSERTARVQALADPLSAVGVAAAESRSRGIVFGRSRDQPLEYIPEDESEPIVEGAVLITSGLKNSIYPKGLVVGTIRGTRTNFRGVQYGIVEPVETYNAVEEVLVLRRKEATPEQDGLEGMGEFVLDMSGSGDVEGASGEGFGEEPATMSARDESTTPSGPQIDTTVLLSPDEPQRSDAP